MLLQATIAFQRTGKINIPKSEFDCEKVRYEHRFLPFSSVHTPPPMQYSEAVEADAHPPDHARLFMAACTHFHQARTLLEVMASPDQEVRKLMYVALIC